MRGSCCFWYTPLDEQTAVEALRWRFLPGFAADPSFPDAPLAAESPVTPFGRFCNPWNRSPLSGHQETHRYRPVLSRTRGLAYVLIGTVLWSTAEVVVRLIVEDITPIQLGAARFFFGGAFLSLFLPYYLRKRGLTLSRDVLWKAAWMGLVGLTIGNICYQYSLQYTGAAVVATLFGANPLMVLVLSAVLLSERLRGPKSLGVVMGFVGILILAMSEESDTFSLFGFTLGIGFLFGFSLFTVLIKKHAGPYAGLPMITLCTMASAGYLIPLALLEGDTAVLANLEDIWLHVIYLGIGTTGLAYLFFFMGLEHVTPTEASSVLLLKPPLGTVLAAFWLGEAVPWNLPIAMAFILGGLYLVIWLQRRTGAVALEPVSK